MSETPRTDAARQDEHDPYMAIASECSKMEKELAAANAEVDRLTAKVAQLYEGAEEAKQRIKRLEEAGNEMHRYITVTRGLLPECTNIWRKAKEDKL